MTEPKPSADNERLYHCSFCRKSQLEVKTLVSGPGVFVCDECVELCQAVITREAERGGRSAVQSALLPENAPTEKLLKILAGYNGAFESVGDAMKDIVDILREREVSWAAIGESLAVSRQAAWKRFA